MIVGLCTVVLEIAESDSLKDKRQVVKSLLDQLRNKFNVTAAEVGDQDQWRHATLGIANVSNDAVFTNQVLNKVMDTIESNPRVAVTRFDVEEL